MPEPEWQLARCRLALDPEWFFPDERLENPPREAEKICVQCEIKEACLTWAIDTRQVGVWGGTTTRQRQRLARRLTRVHCPGCRSIEISVYVLLGHAVCLACGVSWAI